MNSDLELLSKSYLELTTSDFLTFNDIKDKKNITGVYIIYSPNNEVDYIGSTNKFNIRFGTDLKHESTHTLIRKFLNTGIHINRFSAVNYITSQCYFRIKVCDNKREAEALEHFAIWTLNPKYNK